jgi:hypothetical protein
MITRLIVLLLGLLVFIHVAALGADGSDASQKANATVDLRRVFDNFYKTKLELAKMKELERNIKQKDQDMKVQFRKEMTAYTNLLASASDPSVTTDERDRRKEAVAYKLYEINTAKTNIIKYEKDSQTTFVTKRSQTRNELLKEIFAVINSRDASHRYTLDQFLAFSEKNKNFDKILLPIDTGKNYDGNTIDLTDSILAQLNTNAPAGMK